MHESPLLRRTRMRLTLAISSLAAGGAERVLSTMANHWAARDWSVTLVTLAPTTNDFYTLHPAVNRVELNATGVSPTLWRAISSNAHRVKMLRHAIRESQPDAVISLMASTKRTDPFGGAIRRRARHCIGARGSHS